MNVDNYNSPFPHIENRFFNLPPKRNIYNWNGTIVQGLEPDVRYSAFSFDPATGRRFDQGAVNAPSGEYQSPRLPSPQDWLLVLEDKDKKVSPA